MCAIHVETENISFLLKFPLPKKWNFLDQGCAIHVVTITIGLSYSNRSVLKMRLFLYKLKPRIEFYY